VHTIAKAVVSALMASTLAFQPTPSLAQKRHKHQDRYDDRHYRADWRDEGDRNGRRDERSYDPARHYRSGPDYRAYRMGASDRIYRGSDNRYYCRRDDGTTGLIVGGMAGGVLGHIIAPGGSKTLGAILGAGAGALIGRQVDKGVECR
jgi:hypothetical protein